MVMKTSSTSLREDLLWTWDQIQWIPASGTAILCSHTSLCVPSLTAGYSLCAKYIILFLLILDQCNYSLSNISLGNYNASFHKVPRKPIHLVLNISSHYYTCTRSKEATVPVIYCMMQQTQHPVFTWRFTVFYMRINVYTCYSR